MVAAVITGDVIASSSISQTGRKQLIKALNEIHAEANQLMPDFKPEIFQGDSFQGYTTLHVKNAVRTSIYIIIRMLTLDFRIRISTSVGKIDFSTGESLTSDGSAFQLSGRNMDVLKKSDDIISISIENQSLNEEWEVHRYGLNFLLKRCTALQSEAVAQMLLNKTQQEAADILGIKQPAVQQRLQAAGWPVIQTIIDRFESQF